MELVTRDQVARQAQLVVNEVAMEQGSGVFLIEGGVGREARTINVFYHLPGNYRADSRMLVVIPGAGRNGDSYRDAWIEESERYGVVVLSPQYLERDYGFGDYHLAGLVERLNIADVVEFVEGTNHVRLAEEALAFDMVTEAERWIFDDFDRIFELAVAALGGAQDTYDVFGHSAGGQILHRMALFDPASKADRIIAANSGSYTVPDREIDFPFGLGRTALTEEDLERAFQRNLVLLVGERDDENETGGRLLRSPSADRLGLHRLARGKAFYQRSLEVAEALGTEFRWQVRVVPGVGHGHRKMGDAAARLLYGGG